MSDELQQVSNSREAKPGSNRVLVVGPVGVGKTTQFVTLPGRKFMYVFDPNAVASLEGCDVDYIPFVPDVDDLDLSVKTLKREGDKIIGDRARKKIEPTTYLEWEEDFEKRLEAGFFDTYDWIGVDSLTTLSEIVMDRVLHLNKRLGKHPEQPDYTAEMNTIKNIFRVLTNLSCNLYCTAHTELQKDDTSGKTYAQLLMTGRNRVRIPMRFTQIYALEVDAASKTPYLCNTVQDRWNPSVRTNIKGLQPKENVTIDWSKSPLGQGIGRFVSLGAPTKESK